jgi:ATP-binding cassette subfamily B protein
MENIRLGKKNASDSEVIKAAQLAQCDDFVSKLPQGYNTLIGENGEKLSGGERQRISIARAMLKDAPIILLDEATASLDAENESKIQSALSELIKEKTVLIIAHRMRTVSGADKIVVIKDGRIAETGKPQDLKKEEGIFSLMLKRQYR